MNMKKKKSYYTVLLLIFGFIIYFILNASRYIYISWSSMVASEQSDVFANNADSLSHIMANSLFSTDMSYYGTVAVSVIGGSIPGMLAALMIGIVEAVGGDSFFSLAINIMAAFVCLLFRNRELLRKKRFLPIAALVLTVFGYLSNFSLDSLYSLPVCFVLLSAELFFCRGIMVKLEKIFPIKAEHTEKIYRDHSIKRDILLLINVSSVCLSVVFVIFGAMKYKQSYENRIMQYYELAGEMISRNCREELNSLCETKDMDSFDDTQLTEIVSEMATNETHISRISFLKLESTYIEDYYDLLTCIGYIDYSFEQNDRWEKILTDKIINNVPYEVKGFDPAFRHTYCIEFENGDQIFLAIGVEDFKDDHNLINYIFTLIFISAAIIVFANIFADRLMNRHIIIPVNRMASSASAFAYDTDEHRTEAMNNFKALAIASGDEVENLYNSITKTMEDMNDHIINIKEQARRISDMQHNIILTMADIVESRDENTGGHIRRTAEYVKIIAESLRENGRFGDILTDEYIEDMIVAAPLHDMGKIHVSDSILNKPGKLDKDEYAVMQSHTTAGRDLLKNATHTLGAFSYLDMAVQMAAYHHEKWNGKGYPEGISGEDIPLCARIMAVADVFDALISKRCYKEPMPLEKAYSIIREGSGEDFDPVVVDAFFSSSHKIEQALKDFE